MFLGSIINHGELIFPFQSNKTFLRVYRLATQKNKSLEQTQYFFLKWRCFYFPREAFLAATTSYDAREIIQWKIYKILFKVSASNAHLNEAQNVVQDIAREEGNFNIFLTLSSGEHRWPDLRHLLLGDSYVFANRRQYFSRLDLVT